MTTDATFNLLQLQERPSWYEHLAEVEAAMRHESRITNARLATGWGGDEGGWYSPDGIHETEWEEQGLPFPEDEGYTEFAAAHF